MLVFLHDLGLLHRDPKPANLLVRSRPTLGGRLVVLDFAPETRDGVVPAVTTVGPLFLRSIPARVPFLPRARVFRLPGSLRVCPVCS